MADLGRLKDSPDHLTNVVILSAAKDLAVLFAEIKNCFVKWFVELVIRSFTKKVQDGLASQINHPVVNRQKSPDTFYPIHHLPGENSVV